MGTFWRETPPTETPELSPTATNVPASPTPTIVLATPTPGDLSFLTVPFYPNANFQRPGSPFGQDALPDLYNDTGIAIAYDGRTNPCTSGQFPCAHDKHDGIDFGTLGNTPVRAAYSGTVYQRFTVNVPNGDPPDVHKLIIGTGIDVRMPIVYRNGDVKWEKRELCLQYVHLFPSVDVGDSVARGDEIGLIDPRGGGPHLHMEVDGCKNGNYILDYQRAPIIAIDPYLASESTLQRLIPLEEIPISYLNSADAVVIPSNYISSNGLWLYGHPEFP